MVIVALRESGRRIFIQDKDDVGMELECGGADRGTDRTFNGFRDGVSFRFSRGENEDSSSFQNGADAHRDGTFWNFRSFWKKAAIVFDRFLRQFFQASAGSEAGIGLVETDVAIAADAENLEVDSAGLFNGAFVFVAVGGIILAKSAAGDVDSIRREIYVLEKIGMHEVVKALWIVGREAQIFVQIEAGGLREIEALRFVKSN